MKEEQLSLATLCGGALQEKVDRALRKVAENILDPNTDPEKKRSITVKLVFKPSPEDTEDVALSTEISVSLAPEVGASTNIFVSKDLASGGVTVMEHHKGVIRGQISFDELGRSEAQDRPVPAEPEEAAPKGGGIIDYQKKKIG